MKHFFTIFLSLLAITSYAQTPQVKKAAQAVFSLNTFRADGSLISTSHGIFVSPTGDAISQWKPFVGAAKAIVIDANGKKYDVDGLVGANDLYDVCKFHVSGTTPSATVAKTSSAAKTQLWLACYAVKNQQLLHATVSSVEDFSSSADSKKYPFYILNIQTPEDVDYCPVLTSTGEVAGLLQTTKKSGTANAVSALFVSDMSIQQFGDAAATIASSSIPQVLPDDFKEAQITLILAAQQRKTESYRAVIDAFIKKFPNKPDGYEARARQYTIDQDFSSAKKDMEKAIAVAEDKSETHNIYSQLILEKELYMSNIPYADWSLDKALSEAQTAYESSNNPAYLTQKGKVLFAQKKYDEACQIYLSLQETSLAGPETMYSAAQCKVAADAPLDDIILLMDSTIAVCPHPLTYQSAPYVFQRGLIYQDHSAYRKAWQDYNQYEKLMVGNQLPAEFYYNRFICEREARLYQQAIDDIAKAISLQPRNYAYYCEQGSLQLRLKKYDEAIKSANQALIYNSHSADAYAVLGAAQCSMGKKHEGILNLEQAKDLGYESAAELISKFKK